MKKLKLVFLFALFGVSLVAQDIQWQVVEETKVFRYINPSSYEYVESIPAGTTIKPLSTQAFFHLNEELFFFEVFLQSKEFMIPSESVIPMGTEDMLPSHLLTSVLHRNEKDWFSSRYLDVVQSRDRNTVWKYAPNAIKNHEKEREMDEYVGPWWESYISDPSQIFQTVLKIKEFDNFASFYITNIERFHDRFVVDTVIDKWYLDDATIPSHLIPPSGEGEGRALSFTLSFDGEYMDISVNDVDDVHHLGTFVQMDSTFEQTANNFIKTNVPLDISKIRWPRRSDGSSDYDDKRIINPHPGMRYRTAARLRVRNSQDVASDILTTLEKDTKVFVLDNGMQETIDGITSNWVQVELEDGSKGWCFGGFLYGPIVEAVPAPKLPVVQYSETPQETEINKETDLVEEEPKEVPDYTIPFLGGVGFLILGIIAVVMARKRKKQS